MSKVNMGKIDEHNNYVKHVNYNKAVLWMDREISLHRKVVETWYPIYKFKNIRFIDDKKKVIYEVPAKDAIEASTLKKVGQEAQYYFPIELLNKLAYE